MNEAKIILPRHEHTRDATAWLENALLREFGGYTATEGRGAWQSPDGTIMLEPVTVLDVACQRDIPTVQKLRLLAYGAGARAAQQAVYLRLPDGAVEFIDTSIELDKSPSEPVGGFADVGE